MLSSERKVLVVEDETWFADALSDLLGHDGFQVIVASDERTAMRCLNEQEFDVMLLDLMLPPDLDAEPLDGGDRTGIRILRRLRQINNQVPVIVLSVVRDVAVIDQAEDYGVVSYLAKPASTEAILREIWRAINQHGAGKT